MICLYHLLCDGSHLDNATNMCHFGLSWIWACLGKTAYQNTSTRKMKNKQVITKNMFLYLKTRLFELALSCWMTRHTRQLMRREKELFVYLHSDIFPFFLRDIYVINTFVCTYWLKSTRHCRVDMQFIDCINLIYNYCNWKKSNSSTQTCPHSWQTKMTHIYRIIQMRPITRLLVYFSSCVWRFLISSFVFCLLI
jgi:hypothetical protein